MSTTILSNLKTDKFSYCYDFYTGISYLQGNTTAIIESNLSFFKTHDWFWDTRVAQDIFLLRNILIFQKKLCSEKKSNQNKDKNKNIVHIFLCTKQSINAASF